MKDLKSLFTASVLAFVISAATPALANEHKDEDGKKVEEHGHKDGDHKDHNKKEGHSADEHHDHKGDDVHGDDKEKATTK